MADTSNVRLPLSGIRVLDFTHAAAGPFATMLMADMGAEVIKIERPGQGDGSRTMGEPMPGFPRGNSDYYLSLNRNKRGLGLDLGKPEGVEIATDLARTCDVVVQNFRPGVLDRLGLGFEALRKVKRGLVYASISAFGSSGPLADQPANDIIMQSVSGLMGVTGEVEGGPVRIGAPISDFSSGLFALAGLLAALYARDRHPEGQHVEVAMLDASFNLMCNYMPSVLGLDAKIPRLGRGHAQIVPYQAFSCSDDEYVMVGAFTRNFWENLCRVLGHEDWLTDDRFRSNSRRLKNRAILIPALEAIFRTRPRAEWLEILARADVPSSPVLDLHEAVATPQAEANGSFETIDDGRRRIRVARTAARSVQWGDVEGTMPPELGADSRDILRDLLSLSDARVDELFAAGVLAGAHPHEIPAKVA